MVRKTISLNECYKVLQIPQNSSMKEVKHAYRKWAFDLHPDLNPNNASANVEFQKLNEAYVTIIAYLDAQDKKMSAKGSFFNAKSDAHKAAKEAAKEAAKQKAWAEELKTKEERAKKEQERKERSEREKQADERRRAQERLEREKLERNRLREHIEKEDVKRKEKKATEKANILREEAEKEIADKNRLMKQMEDEAKKREAANTKENNTRSYSSHGKPIPDQKKYHGSSNGPDTYEGSSQSQNEQFSHAKFSNDDEMREKILQELLEDDYARKVYEDIYNELHARKNEQSSTEDQDESTITNDTINDKTTKSKTIEAESVKPKNKDKNTSSTQTLTGQVATGIKQGISGWFKSQIDDELELLFPASKLIAGARMRLQIRVGWSGELQVLELTLPPDFVPGKPFRLRGMGKKIGKWQGDLYLKLQAK